MSIAGGDPASTFYRPLLPSPQLLNFDSDFGMDTEDLMSHVEEWSSLDTDKAASEAVSTFMVVVRNGCLEQNKLLM